MGQKIKIFGWLSLGLLAGALATVSLQTLARGAAAPLPLDELQQFATVFGMIKKNYVEPVSDKKLVTDAIAGMVAGLDPHSQYLDQKALKEFNENTSGKFVGVGIEITQENGLIKVISPIEGSPAFAAGIKPNDLIVTIDDTPVRGLSLSEGVKRMRGDPDTKVRLFIFRESENRSFPLTIVRQEIRVRSVRSKVIEPGYAWIRVSQFQERTMEDFARQAQDIYQQEPQLKGLVLDLRNDPGGYLDAAVGIASAFLPAHVTVVSANGQLPESKMVFKAAPQYYLRPGKNDALAEMEKATQGLFKTVPLVVLVNEGSASASEIVAGALQDHQRATLLGSQTFGKGSVQTAVCLDRAFRVDNCPSAAVKLTTSFYYTPSGKSIQAKGIVPQLMVDETKEGNLFAALRTREADLDNHLGNTQVAETKDPAQVKAREEALQKLDEELRKPPSERKAPEYGSAEDFQLTQALNQLKGLPVLLSKTQVERKEEKKEP